ncbi:MAG: hypothetical protein ABEI52_10035, partial [Halobacteriaceae archaeon]
GDIVHDHEDETPDDAVVVNTPPVPANEWEAPGLDGTTVADDNPDYPADAPVAIIVYKHHLAEYDSDWLAQEDPDPIPVRQLREDNVLTYSFPAPRLERTESPSPERADASESSPVADEPACTEDHQETEEATESTDTQGDEAADDSDPVDAQSHSPAPASPAVQALKERLEDSDMTVEVESDGQTLRAAKLGEQYRVQPGEVIEGDGALRNRLESVVAQFGDGESDHEPEPQA